MDAIRKHAADRLSVAPHLVCYHPIEPSQSHPSPGGSAVWGGILLADGQFERMAFLSELRYPTTWYFKLAIIALSLLIFLSLAAAAAAGYLAYQMMSPAHNGHSDIKLQDFPGHPEKLTFSATGGSRDGWFFPGLKSAPSIILCPGYESSRGEILTLASALQDQQYNVLVFDFSGHGAVAGKSTLGYQEVGELKAAMDAVANRGDVDAKRFGLWGENMGAYVALAEATKDRRVRAVAVESAYGHPKDMVALLVSRAGLGSVPLVTGLSQTFFGYLNSEYKNVQPLKTQIANLTGVAQLYLEAPDEPLLASDTAALYKVSPAPHDMVVLQRGNYAGMGDDEKRTYENRIASFFLASMPPTNRP